MSSEIEILEARLRAVTPRELPPELRDRLEACLTGTWNKSSTTEEVFAKSLAQHVPASPSGPLIDRLEASLATIDPHRIRKIIHFPVDSNSQRASRWPRLAAVATVALAGVLTALLVPVSDQPSRVAGSGDRSPSAAGLHPDSAAHLVPAGFRRGLDEAKNEGIVMQPNGGPMHMLRLVYRERVTLRDPSGKTYEVERPRTEFVFVPAKVD